MNDVIFFCTNTAEFNFLSNFSSHPILIDGQLYKSVEHFYQSQKFDTSHKVIRDTITNSTTSDEAAAIGRSHSSLYKKEWDAIKLHVMRRAIHAKLSQHPSLLLRLLQTAPKELIELSETDYFWGCGHTKNGLNNLGKILMDMRDNLTRNKVINPDYFNFNDNDTTITEKNINEMVSLIGWESRSDFESQKVPDGNIISCHYKTPFENFLIGIIRYTSDNYQYTCLYDLIVHPFFQKNKVGSTLLSLAISKNKDVRLIHLFAEPWLMKFYEKFQFKPIKTGMFLTTSPHFDNLLK